MTDTGALIAQYVSLRDQKKNAEEVFKAWLQQHYIQPMDDIEAQLLGFLNDAKSDSISAAKGTAYKALQVSVRISEPVVFQNYVIQNKAWHLVDWRASKTAVNDLVDEEEPLPPGISRDAAYKVNIRRS